MTGTFSGEVCFFIQLFFGLNIPKTDLCSRSLLFDLDLSQGDSGLDIIASLLLNNEVNELLRETDGEGVRLTGSRRRGSFGLPDGGGDRPLFRLREAGLDTSFGVISAWTVMVDETVDDSLSVYM